MAEKESQGRIKDFIDQTVKQVFKDNPQVLADFEQCVREQGPVRREAPYQLITTGEIKYYVTTYNYVPPDLVVVHIQDITLQNGWKSNCKPIKIKTLAWPIRVLS
ncbi:MAG: hypothetical protein HC807_07465 [Gammaproteobacteria bacterium]|nr:hypothetical protein [Gammaproteobacteria bacterium]